MAEADPVSGPEVCATVARWGEVFSQETSLAGLELSSDGWQREREGGDSSVMTL